MNKTMSLALALAFALAWKMPSAGAMSPSATLSGAVSQSDIVSVVQKQRRSKSKREQIKLSDEHKQKIRETVPREYHQYLPKSITGSTPAATGAAGVR